MDYFLASIFTAAVLLTAIARFLNAWVQLRSSSIASKKNNPAL
jgi:hypothetical protein